MTRMAKALEGITVVEFAAHPGSAYATMLLAEHGARAIKIEPRDGDPSRGEPHFHALNRSKQSVFLDLDSPGDMADARELLNLADIVVSGFTPARQRSLGLDYQSLGQTNPRLLLLQMPPLGSRGPYAEIPAGCDLVQAWSGMLASQNSLSGNPVDTPFPLACYQAGLLGAAAAVAGLIATGESGSGQSIELSLLAAALSIQSGDYLRNPQLSTIKPGARDPMGPYEVVSLYKGGDGRYLIIDCPSMRFCHRLADAIGRPELFSDPRFNEAPWRVKRTDREALRGAIAQGFLARPRDEWIPILRAHDVPSAPVQTRREFFEDSQVRHMGMRREIDDPTLGPTLQVGVPLHLARTPGEIQGPAPALDRSNPTLPALIKEARNASRAGVPARHGKEVSRSASSSARTNSTGGPLAGIVVIDLSSYIAGSFGPMLLAQMGATVIKVESREGDSLRPVSGFRGWNQSKRGLVLNLKTPQGLAIVHDLVRKADVVVENFRPGRTRELGIDYETLAALKPGLVYMSVTGYGTNGPDYDRPGLDPLVQSESGSYSAMGGEGRLSAADPDSPRHPIYMNVAMSDYGAATLSALGCLLALRVRQVTGLGQYCETSLLQSVLALQAGEFIFYAGRPNLENCGGAESRGATALHRAYQCQDGRWLYIAISLAPAWEALRSIDPKLPALTFEQARREEPDGSLAVALAEHFASAPFQTHFDTLRSRGIPVAPVPHISQVFDDAQVRANELTVEVEDPKIGTLAQLGHLVKFSNGLPTLSAAPALGEHSEQVLTEFLDYGADRIAQLREAGIIFQD
jgi:crotonobetainyl-CoA:carnitine CoA-transferase CaiB-like acyl-CoA transferase